MVFRLVAGGKTADFLNQQKLFHFDEFQEVIPRLGMNWLLMNCAPPAVTSTGKLGISI